MVWINIVAVIVAPIIAVWIGQNYKTGQKNVKTKCPYLKPL